MKVTKKVIGELNLCYSIATLDYQGEQHILVAAEKEDPCYLFDLDGKKEEQIWDGPGGVMTMKQIPGTDGEFLATRMFYSPNNSKEAHIVHVRPRGKNDWEVRKIVDLPFIHRFDILKSEGKYYLIFCALKSGHEFKEDWSMPGRIFVAEMPADFSKYDENNQLPLTCIKEGLLKNHGYYAHNDGDGNTSSIVSTDNGVFHVHPPKNGADWQMEMLVADAASDGLLLDLNGDGAEELCTIAPFHGDTVNIYEKKDGKYQLAYTHPEKLEFLHAIFGGKLAGKNRLILGHRKGARKLLSFTYENGTYQAEVLDEGRGAANVLKYEHEGKEILVATNRETNEIALYECAE